MLGRDRRPRRALPAAAASLAGALLALSGCTGVSSGGAGPPASDVEAGEAAEAGEPEVPTALAAGEMTGRLALDERRRTIEAVAEVVDGWLDAAYVDGTYPRDRFDDSWPGFTAGAARTAAEDSDLMSNADIGDRTDEVRVRKRTVTVDLLAVEGAARAATARVRLVFVARGADDADRQRVVVTGRVFLDRSDGAWRVFGYDVAKDSV